MRDRAVRENGAALALADGGSPLFVAGRAGAGHTPLVATADTWRLREIDDGRYHPRLWAEIVGWLARRDRR